MRRNKPEDVFKYIDIRGPDECWPFTGRYNEKARNCYWSCGGVTVIPYRVVWELMTGETLKSSEHILHTCDNVGCPNGWRLCCNFKHMYKGDQQQNSDDMKQRERHGLPHHAVRAIKVLCVQGKYTDAEIAERFGISRRHVNNIRNGNRYSHVQITQEDDNEDQTV